MDFEGFEYIKNIFWPVVIFGGLAIAFGVFFAPLGCWSRLAKIDKRIYHVFQNTFDCKIVAEETLKVQKEILAELKKLNKESSS